MSKPAEKPDPPLHGAWFEEWTLIPQDASGDLNLAPFASKLCTCCNCICIILMAAVHATQSYSDTTLCARHTGDATIPNYFMLVGNLALAGLFFEVAWAVSIRYMGLASLYRSEISLRKRLRLNIKMLFCFVILAIIYHLLAFDMQVVHTGWLAQRYGGHQIVYSVRYIEWATLGPLVMSINGQLEHTAEGRARNGLIPSAMLTGIYTIIAWQGLVVKSVVCAWVLICFAFLCYFAASAEQLAFAWYIKDKGKAGPLRASLLVYLVVIMGLYGVVYLLPIQGWIPTTLENKLYCFGDASFKLGTAAMLVVSEDVCATVEMWRRAVIFAEDQTNLIDSASVPIFGVDAKGVVTQVNERAKKLLPLRHDDILGMPMRDLVLEADRENCWRMIESALATDLEEQRLGSAAERSTPEPVTLETSIILPGQEDKQHEHAPILEMSATSRRNKKGEVTGATLIGHDITAYKHAEERKARFMATMSHELRSPLHGIIGLSEHLASEEKNEARSTSLNMITTCSKRLLGLVVDIMDMASLAAKKNSSHNRGIEVHKDPVELGKIIDEVLTLVRNSRDKFGKPLLKRGVRLVNEFTKLPIIEADAAKCTQVFFNLVTNACKFTKEGSITVSSELSPDGESVHVAVTDTGTGISSQNIERIFRPFEQEDNSMSRGHDGLGLGLAIANEVVKLHGGNIRVASKLGKGTTFTVRLPVVAKDVKLQEATSDSLPLLTNQYNSNVSGPSDDTSVPAAKELQTQESEPRAAASARSGSRPRREAREQQAARGGEAPGKPLVLSVDDDLINQLIVEKQLGDEYHIIKALDGEQACDVLRRTPQLDLVLLDYNMPKMNGIEVLKFIRQEMKMGTLDVPVLMVSAAATSDIAAEALHLGCNDYVNKPFEGGVLKARMRAALAKKQLYAERLMEMREARKAHAHDAAPPEQRPSAPQSCWTGLVCSPSATSSSAPRNGQRR